MRKAELKVFTFEVYCPYCVEKVSNPDDPGRLVWRLRDVQPGQLCECDMCGNAFILPQVVALNHLSL